VVAMIYAAGETAQSFSNPTVTPAKAGAELGTVVADKKPDLDLRRDDGLKGTGVRATPLARRLAKQAGVALSSVSGSGPRGRITSADVQSAQAAKPNAVAAPLNSGMETAAIRALYQDGTYEVKPLDGMRRTIAQRLVQSKQTVPHFYLSATCTIDTLMATRERLNAAAPKRADKTPLYKLSINDFVIKAMAVALQKVPAANVTFTDDGILQHSCSDVGVAVSVEGGLFTPIVRNAEGKSLSAISAEMKELAAKARARKLQAHEYQGGTAAISNLGMFGVEQFTAIINPPHASILAVGAAVERFIPVNKQPVLATQMSVTLSCDHRAVDGAVGAELLAAFKALIEEPALMLV
jgi:pyruvate dehydrogenase E2 component (dihydrolipoamide acetyltransferase)